MAKLKLRVIDDDKPVKLTIDLPAAVHRDLVAYGEALGREAGHGAVPPAKLAPPMLGRFMAADRAFAKVRRSALSLTTTRAGSSPRTSTEQG